MNCKTRPLYELCYDCEETFDTACYLCYKQNVEELKEVGMGYVLELWNKKKILNKLSTWLENQKDIKNFTFTFYTERNLTIKIGGKQDLRQKYIIPGVKEWMCKNPIENIYIIEEHIKSVKIITI